MDFVISKGLKYPVTTIRVELNPRHDYVSIFVNHALAGTVTVRNSETYEFVSVFLTGPMDEKERKALSGR